MANNTNALIKALRKQIDSAEITKSKRAGVSHYIDTGNYALNLIFSGDMKKGIPGGRVVSIGGEEASGKSLLAQCLGKNALNVNNYNIIFFIDSEGGIDKNNFARLIGANIEKVEHVMVKNIEDCSHKLFAIYDQIEEIQKEDPDFRAYIVLDSLGALITRKAFTDVAKDEQKLDQGLRARMCNDMIKGCMMPAIITDCGLFVITHIYDQPNANVGKVKAQSGGRGLKFASHIAMQCDRSNVRVDKSKRGDFDNYFSGVILNFFTTKNRIVQPFLEANIDIDFTKGFISKYSGLLDMAMKYGFVEDGHGIYTFIIDGKKHNVKKDKIYEPEGEKLWDQILDALNTKASEAISYGGVFNKYNEELEAELEKTEEE